MIKKLMLAGALAAVLASPAFAETPYSAADPYNSDAKHLNAQTQGAQSWAQGGPLVVAPSGAALNTNNGPNGTVIRGGEVVGQDPDPAVRATLGSDYDQHGYN